jgi:hypothetical protein
MGDKRIKRSTDLLQQAPPKSVDQIAMQGRVQHKLLPLKYRGYTMRIQAPIHSGSTERYESAPFETEGAFVPG